MAPSARVADAIARTEASNATDKTPLYEQILADIQAHAASSPATADDLNAVADSLFGNALGVVSTRAVLAAFVTTLNSLADDALSLAAGGHALVLLSAQPPSSFADAAADLGALVADAHEADEDFLAAARALAAIPLDGPQRKVDDAERARVWVRIVRNYLEVGDAAAAETHLNKLRAVAQPGLLRADPELALHFALSQARVQDAKRDFLGAATRYHEVSLSPTVAEEERLRTLGAAARCAVLAPAGPARSRALGRLYKDDRAPQLPEFSILENMFLDRLLAPAEVDAFARSLPPHQLATTADGTTVLARAVIEHNLRAASRLYDNIRFDALGTLLGGLDADAAELTTARMIEQGRLVGRIDQLTGFVYFSGDGEGVAGETVNVRTRQWDANVESLAQQVEQVTNALQKEFPDFVAAHLAV
ncbi:COP9 signalosome subunit CsnD [Cordyceps fumosorosea ARSEF 2679]|uniref:COP9 signalosome complex subunit 4 n=1 Tax=Cordyceps fumosorosea (strain ARSEF 2679) TaxID=1081104 RepID=A0A168EHT0_CORFA|nr:COP9 signalosome subunit CsnD [Cordyceps fumosorosea ARSEF 2679]OAA73821.1 COP9 signalosome subunit CsnD [Cordyceps fumosorosea ARSEF 2679]